MRWTPGKLTPYLFLLGLKYRGKYLWYFKIDSMEKCYKTFYIGNLLLFYSNYCGILFYSIK